MPDMVSRNANSKHAEEMKKRKAGHRQLLALCTLVRTADVTKILGPSEMPAPFIVITEKEYRTNQPCKTLKQSSKT
jgi:hypothetical protein